MTGLDVSVSARLVISIINTRVLLSSKPNLGFDLIYFISLIEISNIKNHPFLHCMHFKFFSPRMSIYKPNIDNIISISSFQNGLNHPFS